MLDWRSAGAAPASASAPAALRALSPASASAPAALRASARAPAPYPAPVPFSPKSRPCSRPIVVRSGVPALLPLDASFSSAAPPRVTPRTSGPLDASSSSAARPRMTAVKSGSCSRPIVVRSVAPAHSSSSPASSSVGKAHPHPSPLIPPPIPLLIEIEDDYIPPPPSRLPLPWPPAAIAALFEANILPGVVFTAGVMEGMELPVEHIYNDARAWAELLIRATRPRCLFFIGISEGVKHRYENTRYGYKWLGFQRMHALACVTASEARALERRLINHFLNEKNMAPSRCGNQRLGGDGVGEGNPKPHFLYIAIRAGLDVY